MYKLSIVKLVASNKAFTVHLLHLDIYKTPGGSYSCDSSAQCTSMRHLLVMSLVLFIYYLFILTVLPHVDILIIDLQCLYTVLTERGTQLLLLIIGPPVVSD